MQVFKVSARGQLAIVLATAHLTKWQSFGLLSCLISSRLTHCLLQCVIRLDWLKHFSLSLSLPSNKGMLGHAMHPAIIQMHSEKVNYPFVLCTFI